MSSISAIDLIRTTGRLTVGIELPLDNDRPPDRKARHITQGRSRGVPDLSPQSDLVRKIDCLGFAALQVRHAPIFDVNHIAINLRQAARSLG